MYGQYFNSSEKAAKAYKFHVSVVPLSVWHECFENIFTQMQKCINSRGEYFEKQ